MAPVIFWALRGLLALAAIGGLIFNWRLGLILAFTAVAEFVTYLWMALPLFSVRNELIAIFSAGMIIGFIVSAGSRRIGLWIAPLVSCSILVVLRASMYTVGHLGGLLEGSEIVDTLPSTVILVVGAGASLLAPGVILRLRATTLRP